MNLLPELQSLAALASSDPEVRLESGEPGCQWSFNWSTRTITGKPEDLALRPSDYCRGLILHESAHAALTRLGDIVPPALYQADLHPLLNVVEDCRIENWLQQRFPGCRPWIRLYNDWLFADPSEEARARLAADPAGGFLAGLLDRWWNQTPVLTLHPEAAAALAEVVPHFDAAVAAFPDPALPDPVRMRAAYRSHPVSLCFRARDRESDPTPEECLIRMLQHRMWGICWRHIVPVFRRLLEHPDSEPTRRSIAVLEAGAAMARLLGNAGPPLAAGSPPNGTGRPRAGTRQVTRREGPATDYHRSIARHGPLIESSAAALLRVLTVDSRPQRTRFHPSGSLPDLRVAMQAEADARLYVRLWQRTTLPRHPDPAFVLLIDRSGSMRGEKAAATFDALVVMREVCLRLGIPLTIIAFGLDAAILQSCHQPMAPGVPAALAGLLQPTGGTDIRPALNLACRSLAASPNRHLHLWILSDGETSEPAQPRRHLQTLRAGGVMVHGLGLGPDSDGLTQLVPKARTGLAPRHLPGLFTELLRHQVGTAR